MSKTVKEMEIIPMDEALERLSYFRARNIRQTTLYRGPLTIGKDISFPVYVYSKTAEAKPVFIFFIFMIKFIIFFKFFSFFLFLFFKKLANI